MAGETGGEQRALYTPDMQWEDVKAFPGNVKGKLLREDQPGGAKTMLVRLAVGATIAEHVHTAPVQHYVLEGEYESAGKTYRTGTFRYIPAHQTTTPITTAGGCLILMIYDPVCA